jgi:hypothetical protein
LIADSAERWTLDQLVGLQCELIDSVRIENYTFREDGLVAAIFGNKKVSQPHVYWMLNWKIRNGRLQLFAQNAIREELTLINMQNGILTVRRKSGEIARFRYHFEHPNA